VSGICRVVKIDQGTDLKAIGSDDSLDNIVILSNDGCAPLQVG